MFKSIFSFLYMILILLTSQIQMVPQKDDKIVFTGYEFCVELIYDYSYDLYPIKGYDGGITPVIIDSKEELSELLSGFRQSKYYDNIENKIFRFAEGINENYFEENLLITVIAGSGTSGIGLKVTDVIANETETTVVYNYYDGADGGCFPDVVSYYVLFAEVKKSDIVNTENLYTEPHRVYSWRDL